MLFNTFHFLVFFVVVFSLFLILKKYRWMLLLAASYIFYMSWKWEYILIIIISTLIDYFASLQIQQTENESRKKFFLGISLTANLSILFFFKYFEFFIHSVLNLTESVTLGIYEYVLPVGISFYTFQTMSYTLDVYHGRVDAEKNIGKFALFVIYFPQLVAGPIERATSLLGQLRHKLAFKSSNIIPGAKLFLWGLFKKVVIADRVALLVDSVYNHHESYNTWILILATFSFAFQIYCDFSGYSDMAIGISRMFNIYLSLNFNSPYFAHSIANFWHRWHISLSTWFRDYVYIPLGGSRVVKWRWRYNLFITFVISGLWHGANWTFVVWGVFHGLLLVIGTYLPSFNKMKVLRIIGVFIIVNIGWVFFRSVDLHTAFDILSKFIYLDPLNFEEIILQLNKTGISKLDVLVALFAILILVIKDSKTWNFRWQLKSVFYLMILFVTIIFGVSGESPFIYFQF